MTIETPVRGGIGESVRRPDGIPKVKGDFAYASDLWADGMLWGATTVEECVATVHDAVAAGITLLDLAPRYGDGKAELVVVLSGPVLGERLTKRAGPAVSRRADGERRRPGDRRCNRSDADDGSQHSPELDPAHVATLLLRLPAVNPTPGRASVRRAAPRRHGRTPAPTAPERGLRGGRRLKPAWWLVSV